MNKALALLRNVYDDDHGFEITVTEHNGDVHSKYYRWCDYLKAYKYFERASHHYHLKGDERIYKDVEIKIVNIYVRYYDTSEDKRRYQYDSSFISHDVLCLLQAR